MEILTQRMVFSLCKDTTYRSESQVYIPIIWYLAEGEAKSVIVSILYLRCNRIVNSKCGKTMK